MDQITEAVNRSLDKMVSDGAIERLISERLEKTVAEIIDDAFRPYSEFGKSLKQKVDELANVDFSGLGLTGYNDFVLKYIEGQLNSQILALAQTQIPERLKELLETPPDEVTLSALVADFIECMSDSYERKNSESITLIREVSNYGFEYIHLDPESGKSNYSCRYKISTHEGKVYAISMGERDPRCERFLGPSYGFERRITQLYLCKSKLVLDEDVDEIDVDYPERYCKC